MSSPKSNATYIPYQAYRPKRHSRNLSNAKDHSPPRGTTPPPNLAAVEPIVKSQSIHKPLVVVTEYATTSSTPSKDSVATLDSSDERSPAVKKTTFRRLPASRKTQPTHTRSISLNSTQQLARNGIQTPNNSSFMSPVPSPDPLSNVLPPPKTQGRVSHPIPSNQILPVEFPSVVKPSLSATSHEVGLNDKPLPAIQQANSPRRLAPYRPGFQPLGVRRQLTDDFLESRRLNRDGLEPGDMKRVERTKLERRLEKLILLHFPVREHEEKLRPRTLSTAKRRTSIFDLEGLKNMNFNDAGDLWKGILTSNVVDSPKNDLRVAEQRITPWQDDADVSKCPMCLDSFHPLTNRKHHCRICGRVICSLALKSPHRNVLCSTLFVVDRQMRQIEEVGEGVDYGVRKRRISAVSSQQSKIEDETKFLRGVRICRDCRPVLLRQQYRQMALITPPYVELYQKFISLESDIENALPTFQELIVSLKHQDTPTKEAVAARRRLLDSFAHYDKLAKKIRSLPCPSGPGSSQDRIQLAIMMRANMFLQKNMVTLQSIPALRSERGSNPTSIATEPSTPTLDVDAALGHALQPLLEQESLLEVFIEEAQSQRKFEDVKTLKVNLKEIRQEIEKLLDTSEIRTSTR